MRRRWRGRCPRGDKRAQDAFRAARLAIAGRRWTLPGPRGWRSRGGVGRFPGRAAGDRGAGAVFFYFADRGHLGGQMHEGDWQLVQLRLDAGRQPRSLVLARPDGSERLDWEQVETAAAAEGPVAVVYPARGSHAPLARAGTFAAPVVPDHNDGAGPLVRPRLEPIGDGPGWVHWPGRWGATRRREHFEADSPRGPGRSEAWWDPAALEREARPWSGTDLRAAGGPDPPPAPRLRTRREGALAVVEYSFPPPSGAAPPARLIAAVLDGAGRPGPVQPFAVTGRQGSFTLQLPRKGGAAGVRAAAAAADGAPDQRRTAPRTSGVRPALRPNTARNRPRANVRWRR